MLKAWIDFIKGRNPVAFKEPPSTPKRAVATVTIKPGKKDAYRWALYGPTHMDDAKDKLVLGPYIAGGNVKGHSTSKLARAAFLHAREVVQTARVIIMDKDGKVVGELRGRGVN